jgi:hypothetical protein
MNPRLVARAIVAISILTLAGTAGGTEPAEKPAAAKGTSAPSPARLREEGKALTVRAARLADELGALAKQLPLGSPERRAAMNEQKQLRAAQQKFEDAGDDTSALQFEIQTLTSDLQNAENVRSQARKRLEASTQMKVAE